jgi:hypothetical protein
MELIKKIDHKLFWPLSLVSTGGFLLLTTGLSEVLVILGVYTSTLISFYSLMYLMLSIMKSPDALRNGTFNKGKFAFYGFCHALFLFGSIGLGVLFIKKRIILAVLNYVIQIFVLGIGLRKNLK